MDEYLLDQVYLRVSQLNVCAFCTDLHTRMQTKAGMRPETLTLVQIWSHPGHFFSETEQIVLVWAERFIYVWM